MIGKQENDPEQKFHDEKDIQNLEKANIGDNLSLEEIDVENSKIEAVRLGKCHILS
jgi:hypothetical protein